MALFAASARRSTRQRLATWPILMTALRRAKTTKVAKKWPGPNLVPEQRQGTYFVRPVQFAASPGTGLLPAEKELRLREQFFDHLAADLADLFEAAFVEIRQLVVV